MSRHLFWFALVLVPIVGCEFEEPLTTEHSIAIDPGLLGLWEEIPNKNETPDQSSRMLFLRFSDTEYLVHYPIGKDDLYFRCYPIKLGGVSCVQVQVIGSGKGTIPKTEKKRFHVVSYQLKNGELEISLLNTALVDGHSATSEALVKAFLKHKSDKNLFTNPGRFRRVK